METLEKKHRLLELIKKEALFKGDFTLSSGKKSGYYIDMRLVTLSSEGAYLIADLFFDLLKDEDVDAVGGLTMGADPMTGAIAAVSFIRGKPMHAFIVRKEEKKHGKAKAVEGPLKKGARVAVVDDVATTGGSLVKAIEAVKKEGCEVVKVLSVVDREEGAAKELAAMGYTLVSLFSKKDLGI